MADKFTVQPDVVLTDEVREKVGKIADKYFALTQKQIVVTSGTRTAQSQAAAMYGKLAGGDTLAVYRDQTAAQQIRQAYEDGKAAGKAQDAIIAEMAQVIQTQIQQSVFISKHLRSGAVDVRSRDMTDAEKEQFRQAAAGIAQTVLLESTPPHFHLQF